jgi:hypothetical protein
MKKLLLNPFTRIAGLQALILGIVFMLVGALLAALCHARFDGVLDLHFREDIDFTKPFIDQLFVFVSLVVVFYPVARLSGAKPRLIDIAGTFALARAPLTFAPLINLDGFLSGFASIAEQSLSKGEALLFSGMEMFILFLLVCLSLLLIIWMVALYFHAYKTSTNLKGNRLVIGFITGLILAEILSIYLTRMSFNH